MNIYIKIHMNNYKNIYVLCELDEFFKEYSYERVDENSYKHSYEHLYKHLDEQYH